MFEVDRTLGRYWVAMGTGYWKEGFEREVKTEKPRYKPQWYHQAEISKGENEVFPIVVKD